MKKNNIVALAKAGPNKLAFSIIEILVGIFIFSLGLVSIYAVIVSTLNVNEYNKNYIIATNLAREQLELFRNIRDSNYKQVKKYNQINPASNEFNKLFEEGKYYRIENDFSTSAIFPIKVDEISIFGEGESELNGKMLNYNLYIDNENRYTFESTGNEKTNFYRYIKINNVEDLNGIINNSLKVKSKVIWYKKGYHEFEINTIISDWKRY